MKKRSGRSAKSRTKHSAKKETNNFAYYAIMGVFVLALIGIAAFSYRGVTGNATSDDVYNNIKTFLGLDGIRHIVGIVFGLWDIDDLDPLVPNWMEGRFGVENADLTGFLIYVVLWFIILFIFKDLVYIASSFTERTTWVITVGMIIIMSQLRLIFLLGSYVIQVAAYVGAASVLLEIVLLSFLLLGGVWGARWAGTWALKRRMVRESMNARAKASEVKTAIDSLHDVYETFTGSRKPWG